MVRRVVVLGAGYGGLNSALQLERQLSQSKDRNWEIILVDRCNYHQHVIMIHEIAANSTAPEEAVIPLAYLLNGKRITFMQGDVKDVDLGGQQVAFDSQRIDYDRLVVALGSETSYFGIPGAEQNTLGLKSVDDARRINAHIKRTFLIARNSSRKDRASLLTFVVCGGGYSGVELTGELADWLPELALANDIDPSEVRLVVVEAAPTILMGYPAGLPGKASELLVKKGVELQVGSPVAEIGEGMVKIRSGETIAAHTILWTGGVQGPAALAQWGLQTGAKGRAVVNGYLESVSHPGVYVIGDCSLVVNPNTGRPAAPSAQMALQQAPHVAENLEAELVGGQRETFRPAGTGEVFSMGRRHAYAVLGRISFDGYAARLLKEAIALRYYLNLGGPALVMEKMPGALRTTAGGARLLLQRRGLQTKG